MQIVCFLLTLLSECLSPGQGRRRGGVSNNEFWGGGKIEGSPWEGILSLGAALALTCPDSVQASGGFSPPQSPWVEGQLWSQVLLHSG